MNDINTDDWKDWAISAITIEYLNMLRERKHNTLLDQNNSSDWAEFKKYQGRIAELDEAIKFIEEQKKSE